MTISLPVVDITHAVPHPEETTPADPHLSTVAATLASGLIAASGRPHSVHEAVELWKSVHYVLDHKHGEGTPQRLAWDRTARPDEPHA